MNRKDNTEMFKCLAAYVLPEGILSYFDITDITEEEPKDPKIKSFDTDLHIYLDERDNRPKDMEVARSNGFAEEKQILDFPIRGHKTIIHVRRRRWTMPDGKNKVIDLDKLIQLTHPGTRYSKEFALFLKMVAGQ